MKRPASLILTYHSLDHANSAISLRPEAFEQQMRWLIETGIPVVPLTEVLQSPSAVALTFDDGFQNFRELAFPVIQDLSLPATVFVVTGHCGRENRWATQPVHIPTLDLLTWSEIEELARQGVEFGAHTVTHPNLVHLEPKAAEAEIHQSRIDIEDRTGRPVRSFAWPYGSSNPLLRIKVGEEFSLACGTDLRFLHGECDRTNLPRIDMFYWSGPFWFRRQRSPVGRAYIRLRHLIRQSRSKWTRVIHSPAHNG